MWTAVLSKGLDSVGGPEFVRERLVLSGKTLFLVSFGFYVFLFASLTLLGGAPVRSVLLGPVGLGHLAASSVMGVLWLLASRPRSMSALGAFDALSVVLGCGFLAFMTVEDELQTLQVLLAIMVTVMVRAILVPSTARRSMLLTALAFAPTIAVDAALHHPTDFLPGFTPAYQKLHMTLNTVLWSVLGVTLATVVSRVIYGLRRQVAEATDVGQYTLEEKIGSGGMGEVWRARHRLLIRPAAVKLIRPEAMAGQAGLLMRRFEREARATAALTSPHTVQLYDFGVTDDGTLYYVMELLDGLDLDTLVKRYGPLPSERAVHVLRQVCSSLADAHRNGLVHRDIKPANIVVSRLGDAFDFVKVLDFGLVKLDSAQREDSEAVTLTAAGRAGGTPAFMAPEVVLGAVKTDHRVDLYALGCVAYWLLAGALVFDSESAIDVMFDHARSPAPRLSQRSRVPIPAALEDIVMECLEKEPDRRPASAEAVAARLEAVTLTHAWTAERAEKWWGAHLPRPADSRPVADILLSHEGRSIRPARRT